jgi:hypothetical protein
MPAERKLFFIIKLAPLASLELQLALLHPFWCKQNDPLRPDTFKTGFLKEPL